MNSSDQNQLPTKVRSLVIYSICIPLAIWMGYLLASYDPLYWKSWNWVIWGIMGLVLSAPILLRWHHFLMIATWNTGVMLFFLPGSPGIWIPFVCLSLGISILQRAVNSESRFISAPSLTWPLIFFLGVIYFTAKLTGGIGLHSLGNEVAGGRRYIFLIVGVLAYFALTAKRIPRERVRRYIGWFFFGGCLVAIGDLAPYAPSALRYIFWVIPVSGYNIDTSGLGALAHPRFGGLGLAGVWGFCGMMALYGIRGIFFSGKPWRLIWFAFFTILIPMGGFRNFLIFCGMVFVFQFFLEQMHRTKMFPALIFLGLLGIAVLIPFSDKLPYTYQRSLAFLPLKIDPVARRDAKDSEDWRLEIWKQTLPMIPQYLLLGRGYALTGEDIADASNRAIRYASVSQSVDVVGNWHSGPLSLVIPFGIWGVIGVLWFWWASLRALWFNLRYGDARLSAMNKFFFAYYVAKVLLFLVIFGEIANDLGTWICIAGLSVAINGGIRKPSRQTLPAPAKPPGSLIPNRFQPSYQRY